MKRILPKIEILIIIVFATSFLIWAMSKCSVDIDPQNILAAEENATSPNTDTAKILEKPKKRLKPEPPAEQAKTINPVAANYSRLYVTIKNLKLRDAPELNGKLLGELPLFEEVFFMNEVTDSTQQINLGYEVANEPWVKIRTKKGQEGWVYGAGVHYYKQKRKGVLE